MNVVILFVVLMNFLIAIVSETYGIVMQKEVSNIYKFRSQLNNEYFQIVGEQDEEFSQILLMCESFKDESHGIPELINHLQHALE